MSRKHFFVDEAGNFDFSDNPGASRYFILTSVVMDDDGCAMADSLLNLRRELVWEGHSLTDAFHAKNDKPDVRERVFELIAGMNIRIDTTILEKRKTIPERQETRAFYKLAWYLHAKHVIPNVCASSEELMVVAASIGTRKERNRIERAVKDVVDQCGRSEDNTTVSHWPALSDPCLQVADYCCWAIQRKWERGEDQPYVLIKDSIQSEKNIFSSETSIYY